MQKYVFLSKAVALPVSCLFHLTSAEIYIIVGRVRLGRNKRPNSRGTSALTTRNKRACSCPQLSENWTQPSDTLLMSRLFPPYCFPSRQMNKQFIRFAGSETLHLEHYGANVGCFGERGHCYACLCLALPPQAAAGAHLGRTGRDPWIEMKRSIDFFLPVPRQCYGTVPTWPLRLLFFFSSVPCSEPLEPSFDRRGVGPDVAEALPREKIHGKARTAG